MKRLILTVAILVSGLSTFAGTNNTIAPLETSNVLVNDGFKEIAVDKLPTAITDAIAKDFASATISKAYMNSSEQYKIELNVDGSSNTVYADKDGNWLKESDIVSTEKKESGTKM